MKQKQNCVNAAAVYIVLLIAATLSVIQLPVIVIQADAH